jgi:hypothetical protein
VAGVGAWIWQQARVERRFQADRTRENVESALAQLPRLYERFLWDDAHAVLDRAENQLGPDGPADLREKVAAARRNTAFLKRLDSIRLEKSVIVDGKWNLARALPKYQAAFVENGLDVLNGEPEKLAMELNASPVRDYLLRALDD